MLTGLCFCLVIGSLYPKMILNHNLCLKNEAGQSIQQEEIDPRIPVKIRFRILDLWNLW